MGFNPCFNGRCKRTKMTIFIDYISYSVSILVLMEDVKEQEGSLVLRKEFVMFQSLF